MENYEIFCVARGSGSDWEAFCLNFDLAVQGSSFEDVRNRMHEAVENYIEAALQEPDAAVTAALLNRRAPLRVRMTWAWRFLLASLSGKRRGHKSTAGFPVPCHA